MLLHFEHPAVLLFILPTIYLLRRMMKHTTGYRRTLFLISRTFIAALLIAALASPYLFSEQRMSVEKPDLLLLVDNTPSMGVYNSPAEELYTYFRERTLVDIKYLNTTDSPLGDAILENLKPEQGILLLSDGWNNRGIALEDAVAFAASLNSTVYNLKPVLVKKDLSIHVEGSSKTILGQELTLFIQLNSVGGVDGRVEAWLDGKTVTPVQTGMHTYTLTTRLQQTGSHTLKVQAIPLGEDFYHQNNVFYKTLHVFPKPRVLLVTQETSPLQSVLEELYTCTITPGLPAEGLEAYSAIVLDNIPAEELTATQLEALSRYTAEGGGIVFIGGFNSFEYADYEDSEELKTLLPVHIGGGAPESRNTGILILLDISESTKGEVGGEKKLSVEKALAIQMFQDISFKDYIGLISFYNCADVVVPFERGANRNESITRIMQLTHGGTTSMLPALQKAEEILKNFRGTSNIIIISDGELTDKTEEKDVIRRVETLFEQQGITTYTIGVGRDTNERFMKQIAAAGGGLYLRRDETGMIKLLFKDTDEEREQQDFLLTPITTSHFITTNLHLQNATITGYNNVAPKPSARTLIMSDNGKPVVTVMRYGLGRSVAFTTDNGNRWASRLYTRDNSQLISRTINWAVGNPERNQPVQIQATDTHMGETLTIHIKSKSVPQASIDNRPLTLSQVEREHYTAVVSADTPGFHTIKADGHAHTIAVNPSREYSNIGYNEALSGIIIRNGGKTYHSIDEVKSQLLQDLQQKQTRIERSKKNLTILFTAIALGLVTIEIIARRIVEILKLRRQRPP